MKIHVKMIMFGLLVGAGIAGAAVSDYIYEDMGLRFERGQQHRRDQERKSAEAGRLIEYFGYKIRDIKKNSGSIDDYLKAVKQALGELSALFNMSDGSDISNYKSSVWQLYSILNNHAQNDESLSSNIDKILKLLQDEGKFEPLLKFEKDIVLGPTLESKYKNDAKTNSLIDKFSKIIRSAVSHNELLVQAKQIIDEAKQQLDDWEKFMYFTKEARQTLYALEKELKNKFHEQLFTPLLKVLGDVRNQTLKSSTKEEAKKISENFISIVSKYEDNDQIRSLINEFKNVIQSEEPYGKRLDLAQKAIDKAKQQLGDLEKFMYFISEVDRPLYVMGKELKNKLSKPLLKVLADVENQTAVSIK